MTMYYVWYSVSMHQACVLSYFYYVTYWKCNIWGLRINRNLRQSVMICGHASVCESVWWHVCVCVTGVGVAERYHRLVSPALLVSSRKSAGESGLARALAAALANSMHQSQPGHAPDPSYTALHRVCSCKKISKISSHLTFSTFLNC